MPRGVVAQRPGDSDSACEVRTDQQTQHHPSRWSELPRLLGSKPIFIKAFFDVFIAKFIETAIGRSFSFERRCNVRKRPLPHLKLYFRKQLVRVEPILAFFLMTTWGRELNLTQKTVISLRRRNITLYFEIFFTNFWCAIQKSTVRCVNGEFCSDPRLFARNKTKQLDRRSTFHIETRQLYF